MKEDKEEAGIGAALLECCSEELEAAIANLSNPGQPIFEIKQPHQHIKIYANGVVEGIEGEMQIANFIPLVIDHDLDLLNHFSKPGILAKSPKQDNAPSLVLGSITQTSGGSEPSKSLQLSSATCEK